MDGLRSCLIVAEVALAVVLLAGAGLLLRSYAKIESVDAGFSQSTVSMNIQLDARYRNAATGPSLFPEPTGQAGGDSRGCRRSAVWTTFPSAIMRTSRCFGSMGTQTRRNN